MENNEIKYCPKCGAENSSSSLFCSKCGESFSPQNKKKKTSIIPAILAIVFILAIVVNGIIQNNKQTFYNTSIDITNAVYDGIEQLTTINNKIIDISNNANDRVKNDSTDKYTLNENGYFINNIDAVNNYVKNDDFKNDMNKVIEQRKTITSKMEELRNNGIPKDYVRLYADLEVLYQDYILYAEFPYTFENDIGIFSDTYQTTYDVVWAQYRQVISYFD